MRLRIERGDVVGFESVECSGVWCGHLAESFLTTDLCKRLVPHYLLQAEAAVVHLSSDSCE